MNTLALQLGVWVLTLPFELCTQSWQLTGWLCQLCLQIFHFFLFFFAHFTVDSWWSLFIRSPHVISLWLFVEFAILAVQPLADVMTERRCQTMNSRGQLPVYEVGPLASKVLQRLCFYTLLFYLDREAGWLPTGKQLILQNSLDCIFLLDYLGLLLIVISATTVLGFIPICV